ncbi:hypothetical protein D6C98_04906 [Aureobasidium pullulans]|nr:hypothetical protein D6C97_09076 [Aureobasidium pullulans]THY53408.1 hypothetical protein D6C98_04906 [Aureobasidium pullulans]TIA45671.1 hypothetical protein D6C79_05550 [Aureobasidium pullulans]
MDERKPHDAHSVGFFDFWAQAYIFRMLGFLLLLFTILLFLFTTLTQGKKGFMAGRGGDSVSLLFELWFGNNRRRASERSLYCRLYHMSGRFWDTGSCFCGFAISYLLSLSFSFLHRFSLTTGPLDHAGVGFGLRKNTSSSTSIFDLVLVVMSTAMGPCIAASIRLSLSRLRFYRIEAWLPTSIWTAQSTGIEISISTGSQTDKSIIEPLKA